MLQEIQVTKLSTDLLPSLASVYRLPISFQCISIASNVLQAAPTSVIYCQL